MGSHNSSRNQALLLSIRISSIEYNLIRYCLFFSYKMNISYSFLIIAGVIALGAVTAAPVDEVCEVEAEDLAELSALDGLEGLPENLPENLPEDVRFGDHSAPKVPQLAQNVQEKIGKPFFLIEKGQLQVLQVLFQVR